MVKGMFLIFVSLPIFVYLHGAWYDGVIISLGGGATRYDFLSHPVRFFFAFSMWSAGGLVTFIYGVNSIYLSCKEK
jgi:hypothetical protein